MLELMIDIGCDGEEVIFYWEVKVMINFYSRMVLEILKDILENVSLIEIFINNI